jgi:outer membrane protein TolC
VAVACPAAAQVRSPAPAPPSGSPFLGGVPQGTATATPVALTISDVIYRALDHNLGVLLAEQDTQTARGARWLALADLLPNVRGSVTESRRKNNLEAFGFPLGDAFPRIVGPFNVFEARAYLTQTIFDLNAIKDAEAAQHRLNAAQYSYRSARDLVVLVAANLYLQALAADARADAAGAQYATSQALHQQAMDLRASGIVAGIDVVRAEVRLRSDQQRATEARNDAQKTRLELARVIGLPPGQAFTLDAAIPDVPVPTMTVQEALDQAYANRSDYKAAEEQLQAAESARAAAVAEHLPSLTLEADYGTLGLTTAGALPTFNVTGTLNVPIFEGGRVQGHLAQADADLRRRRAEVADMRAQIDFDVRSAFLDLQSSSEALQAATRGRDLASQELTQARDRFAAGVADNIEVVQAQESVASATEQFISAQYAYNIAKAMLARSIGTAEDAVRKYLGGPTNP